MGKWWEYDELEPRAPYDWSPATKGEKPDDQHDFHIDLGCGVLRKGRLGIDRFPGPNVDLVMDLDTLWTSMEPDENSSEKIEGLGMIGQGRMPFPDRSIESIISHHVLEHVGDGFIRLMDECHRILKPGGIFRIIVPLFPSKTAVEDPDHKRYFMPDTFSAFYGGPGGEHGHEGFAVPYTSCRFEELDKDMTGLTSPDFRWTFDDAREMRLTLRKRDL